MRRRPPQTSRMELLNQFSILGCPEDTTTEQPPTRRTNNKDEPSFESAGAAVFASIRTTQPICYQLGGVYQYWR